MNSQPAATEPSPKPSRSLTRIRQLSRLLDNAIAIPGTDYRVGLDPLIGIIPAAGDYLTAGMSAYIIWEAAQLGASKKTLTRMVANVAWDAFAGTIPIAGDLFDVAWKANARNAALLEAHAADPQERDRADTGFVVLLLGAIALIVIASTVVSLLLLAGLWRLLNNL
ncbi:MAG: DUF4112 domain-containing protein [Spirulinaceae cyanobacterium RM2_2_10]|nr:DUF4112 domain-containing protein [Spirulinaceae cyanobacterium SM2_1_0]NJO20040.1 DUF4112 domain-containing protein [Spirulinaceae cyanobacterium RM2_2_10]